MGVREVYNSLMRAALCAIISLAKIHFLAMHEIRQVTLVQAKSKGLFSFISDQIQVQEMCVDLGQEV